MKKSTSVAGTSPTVGPTAGDPPIVELSRLEDRQSWNPTVQVLDLTATDPNLDGFSGGFESGGYGYFVPFRNNLHIAPGDLGVQHTYSGKVARVDLLAGAGARPGEDTPRSQGLSWRVRVGRLRLLRAGL